MALDVTPANLVDEIDRSKAMVDPALTEYRKMVREYETSIEGEAGDDGDRTQGQRCPENPSYEYIGLFVPGVSSNNPRVVGKSRRPMVNGEDARMLGYALTDLCIDQDYVSHAQVMAYDMAFLFGASVAYQAKEPSYSGLVDAKRPRLEYVGPGRFLIDPSAHHWLCARWTAHSKYWDIDELRELAGDPESGWNAEMVEQLNDDQDVEDGRQRDGTNRDVPTRKQVVCWEMHVPEHELDDSPGTDKGFNGTVFTVVTSQQNTGEAERANSWIRRPRPFFGPRWGPHTVYGAYWTPGSPIPLSPLRATRQQALEQQAHARAISKSALDYKRVVFVDATNKDLAEQMKKAPHDLVVPVQMPKGTEIMVVEVGGVTDQMLQHFGITRERFDRMLSMHDAQRGVVTGDGTARENMIAAESTASRVAFLKSNFQRASKRELTTLAYWMKNDEDSVQAIRPGRGRGAAREGGFYKGGKDEREKEAEKVMKARGQPAPSFEDFDIDIAPKSMEFTSDVAAQQAALQRVQILAELAPAIMQFPFVRWQDELSNVGDAFNDPNLGESVDFEMAAQMGAEVAARVGAQGQGGGRAPQAGPKPVQTGPGVGMLPPGGGGGVPGQARPAQPNPIQQPVKATQGAQPMRR